MSARRGSTSPCKGEVGREAAGRGSKRRYSRTPEMTKRARRLRAQMTDAEGKLWRAVRRNQLNNLNFRRRHPMGPYTLDFYCPTLRLAIEIDGGQHTFEQKKRSDQQRTDWLKAQGIHVVRFWNNDVLSNIEGVLIKIACVASNLASGTLSPSPTLPLSGGGRTRGQR